MSKETRVHAPAETNAGAPRTLFAPKGKKKLVLDHVTYRVSEKGTITVAAEHAAEAIAQGCTTKAGAKK